MITRSPSSRYSSAAVLAGRLLTGSLLLLGACAGPAAPEVQDPAMAARLAALHEAGVTAPLVLYPVRVLERPDARVADALGLVLEKQGMPVLAIASEPFARPAAAEWNAVPALFAAHVKATPAAAGHYHVYAEITGTPRTGPEQVRFAVVDAAGEVVLTDAQRPGDRDFDRTAGRDRDPLGCMTLVGERLFARADWRKGAGVADGPFARKWRELSGAPEVAEQAAMRPRLAALKQAIATARLAVLPTVAHPGHDQASAQRLAALLHERFGAPCVATGVGDLQVEVDSNEQKVLWSLARGLRSAAPKIAEADYVLVVDVGMHGAEVGYVHLAVCTAAGDYVVVDHQNDQSPMLREAAPKNLADAERFAVLRLARLLP